MNIQGWFPLGLTGLILLSKGLSSLLQHHCSKASILWCSAFFMVQLSYPYMTTGQTKPLTRWTFVGKVRSLLFNMLSRLVITFLPRGKHLLISWLLSTSAVILEPRKINTITVSPSICHEVTRPDAHLFKQVYRTVPYVREGLVLHNNLPFIWILKYFFTFYFFGLQNHCIWWLQTWN